MTATGVAAERSARYLTVACAVDGLTQRGFTEDFHVVDGKLRASGTGETITPEDLVVREYHRFEGISDPDDMAIVYGVEAGTAYEARWLMPLACTRTPC